MTIKEDFIIKAFIGIFTLFVLFLTSQVWALITDPDLNNDGTVTGQDVKIVSTCLGKKGLLNPNCQFELADTDGDGDVDKDDLRYVVNHIGETGYPTGYNIAPIADAGHDQSVSVGATVLLNGGGSSDGNGDPLVFSWQLISLPSGSSAILSDPGLVNPSFTVDLPGTYVVQLVVYDGIEYSSPDEVIISTVNSAPLADAGADQSVDINQLVTLDGSSSSDVDGDALTFSWSLSVPTESAAVLSDVNAVMPTFIVDVPGTYVATLEVSDGLLYSGTDDVAITTNNSAPVANAGIDQIVTVGNIVTLDGRASFDIDGDPLTFAWSLTAVPTGSSAALSSQNSVNPTFVADQIGAYIAQLVVNDGNVDSIADTVVIDANIDEAPTAVLNLYDASGRLVTDGQIPYGENFILDGRHSTDVGGGSIVEYRWSHPFLFPNPTITSAPTLTVDDMFPPDSYIFELIVVDNSGNVSAPVTIMVTITLQ